MNTFKVGGYLYLRDHISYKSDKYDLYKFGSSKIIKNRNVSYKTCEVESGKFIMVIEILNKKCKKVEKKMNNFFKEKGLHRFFGGGTEFFDKSIIHHIEKYLQEKNILYKILSENEINQLISKKYEDKNYDSDSSSSIESINKDLNKEENKLVPLFHQEEVLNKIKDFYKENKIGQIYWACGLGKALLSLMIVSKLNIKSIVIGVPSEYLQKQMKKEILRIFPNNKNIYFIGQNCNISKKSVIIREESDTENSDAENSDNNNKISEKLKGIQQNIIELIKDSNSANPLFFITTYHSSHYLVNNNIHFDFKIGDEAHHLASIKKEKISKKFSAFHHIQSTYALYMTATPKYLETVSEEEKNNIYSMNDEKYFGNIIDKKSISWAIENKKITDYHLNIIYNSEDEVDIIIKNLDIQVTNKELFISAYMTLKSMEKYSDLTHLLIYCNSTLNASIVNQYMKEIIKKKVINLDSNIDDFYINDLHSKKSNISLDCYYTQEDNNPSLLKANSCKKEIKNCICQCEICKFSKSKYGIISSVYIFGEGFDLPKLNGVTFAENMSSEIRIVQSALRPNRLDKMNPNKKAYIILPYIDNKEMNELGDNSFEKCRKIIYEMGNHDKEIEQKIILSKMDFNEYDTDKIKEKKRTDYIHISLNDNCEDTLNTFKMKLRHRKALGSKCTPEEDEYLYVKAINKELKVISIEDYYNKKNIHTHYIEEPEKHFRNNGVWRNWYDFMGIDTSIFIQNKEEWIKFCKEKNIINLETYYENCKIYKELPLNPELFYKDFTNMKGMLNVSFKRRK